MMHAELRALIDGVIRYTCHRHDDEFECREQRDGPDTCDCGLDEAITRLRTAADALAGVGEDTARLDWLERDGSVTLSLYGLTTDEWRVERYDESIGIGPTLRNAIDAARAAGEGQ